MSSAGPPQVTAPRAKTTLAWAVLALVAVTSLWFFVSEDKHGSTARLAADAPYYHSYLPSLIFDRDLDFSNQYRVTKNWYRLGKTETGRPSNVFGIGPALFELPFFGVGHAIARWRDAEPADGFSVAEIKATMYASLAYSLGALFFAYRLLRRRFGGRWLPALIPVLVASAGPVVYYAIRQPGYAHPFATFWAAWLVDYWDSGFDSHPRPRSWRFWLGLGALIGAATLARPQLALWALVLGPIAAGDDIRRSLLQTAGSMPQRIRIALVTQGPRWLVGALLSVAIFSPQLLAWKAIYGAYYVVPQGEGFMRWDDPAWSEVLFSSRNGLFPWAPLYGFALLGLLVGLRRYGRLALTCVVLLATQTVANGAAWDWWAGGSFGGRRFDACFILFVFGLSVWFLRTPSDDSAGWRGWMPRVKPWTRHRWLGRMAIAIGLSLASILAAGNLLLAARQSGPTVRIYGGKPAAAFIERQLPRYLGTLYAAASRAANVPARLVFSWRYDTDLENYDYLVGPHFLGELYPGLNSFRGKRRQTIALTPSARHVAGLVHVDDDVTIADGQAQVLVTLNRRGAILFELMAQHPTGSGEVILRFNGAEIGRAEVSSTKRVRGRAESSRRGMNVLEIEAPPGMVVKSLTVLAATDARGQ